MIKNILVKRFILFVLFSNYYWCFAQDDLLKTLQSMVVEHRENVIATFKGDKIINIETNETVRKMNLDFRISHLFGNIGEESGGGVHNFYGFDQSADIRIAFHFGITDKLMVGISRAKRNESFEGLVKYRVFEQTTDNHLPFALTLFGNSTYSIKDNSIFRKDIYRINYCAQAILARKFSKVFSLVLISGFVHRNFVNADDENNTYHLSGGFRYKFTRSSSFIADYSHTFGRSGLSIPHYNVLGLGFEVETGGHVFSLMFSNASGMLENDYLVNTVDSWGKGGIKLSFIISRMFPFGKEKTSPAKKTG